MSEYNPKDPSGSFDSSDPYGQESSSQSDNAGYGVAPYSQAPYGQVPASQAPIGKVRGTGLTILLFVVTCGLYGLYWFYATSEEMKRHTNQGLGGVLSLVIAIFVTPVSAFLTSAEVGQLYERTGRPARVSALNGLWYFPGCFILVGPLVWFIQTNNALNDYWRSQGAA